MTDYISQFITTCFESGIELKDTKELTPTPTFKRLASSSDKHGKKSVSYFLNIEYDFAYGYMHDFKSGIDVKFSSYNKSASKTDIARIKAMIAIKQAEQEKLVLERQQKIAERAQIIWEQSDNFGGHKYLDRKGIPLKPARIKGQALIVPICDDPSDPIMVSWQSIQNDGSKKFPFGGKKKGCFCILTEQINPNHKIVICEGFATGQTIKESGATNVVCAFDAGNLLHVAQKFRKVYKTTPIVIAADNDISGVGERYALECQRKVLNCSYVMPSTQGHDFNDSPNEAKKVFGGDITTQEHSNSDAQMFDSSLVVPANPQLPDIQHNWTDCLILDDKQRVVSTSVNNAILTLINHDKFKGVFAYDEFAHKEIILSCPPFLNENEFKVKEIDDLTITQCCAELEGYGLNIGFDKCAKAISVACWENRFHPARDYISRLEWDGVERLDTIFQDYFHANQEDPRYLKLVGKKWFTAMVKRLFEPACKFDHVLILESQKQGLFKSTALKVLATFNGKCYCTDSVSVADHANKDSIAKMQGNIIIELAELTGFNSQEDNAIKNWITQQEDVARMAYDRKLKTFPRQFVFVATTNNFDYLKDPTGNRRYMPVTVGGYIDIDGLEEVKEQLWAEAYHLYKLKYYVGLSPSDNDLAEVERAKRMVTDAWDIEVMQAVSKINAREFTTEQIMRVMDLKMNEKNDKAKRRLAKILKMNGYDNRPHWDKANQKSIRYWGKYVDIDDVNI